ncbi:MAG: TerC family protein [Actinomycetota bacterium]|nr:TerC family protein [Actinomycetota bacterium]
MPELISGDFFARLLLVLGVDLILAGDNAVVIAMAARRLEGSQRRQAIIWGAVGAVVLRLIFAAVVAYLLAIPLLQAVGGLVLFWIAWKLIHENHDQEGKVQAGTSTWDAIRIIIVADAVMSLDNVIALVGAARGDLLLLAIGITMTIPLVIFGSALLAFLIDRFPVLIYAGAGLLVYIAVEMFFRDVALQEYLEPFASAEWIVATVAAVVFLAIAWAWARRTGEGKEDPSKLGKS